MILIIPVVAHSGIVTPAIRIAGIIVVGIEVDINPRVSVAISGEYLNAGDVNGILINGYVHGVLAFPVRQNHDPLDLFALIVGISHHHTDGGIAGHSLNQEQVILIGTATINFGRLDPNDVGRLCVGSSDTGRQCANHSQSPSGLLLPRIGIADDPVAIFILYGIEQQHLELTVVITAAGSFQSAGINVTHSLKDPVGIQLGHEIHIKEAIVTYAVAVLYLQAQIQVCGNHPDSVLCLVSIVEIIQLSQIVGLAHGILLGAHSSPSCPQLIHLIGPQGG